MRKIGLEFSAKGKLGFRELGNPPEPGTTDLLLETQYTGITNGTERHALLTEHGFGGGQFPSQHGYQHVARVAAIGEKVTRFKTGDTVYYGDYVGHNGWNLVDESALLIKLPENIEHKFCAVIPIFIVCCRFFGSSFPGSHFLAHGFLFISSDWLDYSEVEGYAYFGSIIQPGEDPFHFGGRSTRGFFRINHFVLAIK